MAINKPRLKVERESKTGLNTHFRDTRTNEVLTRGETVKRVNKGEYPDYHVANINGKNVVKSNPDPNKRNNLD